MTDIIFNAWEVIEGGIGLVPSAIIAIVLLAGPTAIWLLYRFVVQPRTSRYRATSGNVMWVCAACRSVNELRLSHCYRCDRVPDEADLHVIDPYFGAPIPMPLPTPTTPTATATSGIAVGPGTGRPELKSLPSLKDMTGIRGVTSGEPRQAAAASGRDPIIVGQGRPRAVRPRRAVVVGRARNSPDQDEPPAA